MVPVYGGAATAGYRSQLHSPRCCARTSGLLVAPTSSTRREELVGSQPSICTSISVLSRRLASCSPADVPGQTAGRGEGRQYQQGVSAAPCGAFRKHSASCALRRHHMRMRQTPACSTTAADPAVLHGKAASHQASPEIKVQEAIGDATSRLCTVCGCTHPRTCVR